MIECEGQSDQCEDADVAVMGAPYDMGTQWRAGTRFGPRAIREASTLFSFGHACAYDHEDDVTYLADVRMVDIGDADIDHTDTEQSHANIEYGVRKMLVSDALPVVLGGDHSINIPCINASSDQEPIGPAPVLFWSVAHVTRRAAFLDLDAKDAPASDPGWAQTLAELAALGPLLTVQSGNGAQVWFPVEPLTGEGLAASGGPLADGMARLMWFLAISAMEADQSSQ